MERAITFEVQAVTRYRLVRKETVSYGNGRCDGSVGYFGEFDTAEQAARVRDALSAVDATAPA